MNSALILAAEEHTEHLLLGLPTYWFAIIAAVIFLLAFTITVSFSGRGLVRPDHAADSLADDEQEILSEYQSKHNR